MDILGSFPTTSSGNKYLIIVDCFTKWVEAFSLKNIRAKIVAEIFLSQVVSRYGIPLEIYTDQGRNFESKLFLKLMEILGIKRTSLHPQSGQVEQQHQTITNHIWRSIFLQIRRIGIVGFPCSFCPIGFLNMKQL